MTQQVILTAIGVYTKNNDSIEYTSIDAFIERACDAYCKVCGHYAHSVPTHICRHDCRYFSDLPANCSNYYCTKCGKIKKDD